METKQPEQASLELTESTPSKNTKRSLPVEQVQVNPTPDNWISQALSSGRTMEEIQQFIDMRNADLKEKARLAFLNAFKALQEDIPELVKNKAGALNRYKYAELPELQKTLRKPIAKHGFSVSWDQEEEGDTVKVTCELAHEGGHVRSSALTGTPKDVVSGNDSATNGIQKKASLITYLRRYTYTAVLGISSGDQDTDGRVQQQAGKSQPTDAVFKDILNKITRGQMTRADAEKVYNFSAGQLNSLEALK